MTQTVAIDCGRHPVEAALWLARAFVEGRRLAVCAPGAADHAHHVAVEFVHPVITGARALPAHATTGGHGEARLLIGDEDGGADLVIAGDLADADIVRTYHVLWELVQVALEHPGVVGGVVGGVVDGVVDGVVGGGTSAGGDTTGFLYPFLDAAEDDEAALLEALGASAVAKRAESTALAEATLEANRQALDAVAGAVRSATERGHRILTMGNGGSATDAARLVRRLRALGVAADALSADYAVVSALANDLGAQQVFVRQLDAFGQPGDVLIGFSTSGSSPNLLGAFDQASDKGLTTVAISGYRGGAIRHRSVDHLLAVDSQSVHRIQEAQATLIDELCRRVAA